MGSLSQVGSGRQAVGIGELVLHADHAGSLEADAGNNGKDQEKKEEDDKGANEAVVGNGSDTNLKKLS